LENKRAKRFLSGRVGNSGGGRRQRNGEGGCIWFKYCVHIYVKGNMISVETIPGIGVGREGE
jgi:hypothetical protein